MNYINHIKYFWVWLNEYEKICRLIKNQNLIAFPMSETMEDLVREQILSNQKAESLKLVLPSELVWGVLWLSFASGEQTGRMKKLMGENEEQLKHWSNKDWMRWAKNDWQNWKVQEETWINFAKWNVALFEEFGLEGLIKEFSDFGIDEKEKLEFFMTSWFEKLAVLEPLKDENMALIGQGFKNKLEDFNWLSKKSWREMSVEETLWSQRNWLLNNVAIDWASAPTAVNWLEKWVSTTNKKPETFNQKIRNVFKKEAWHYRDWAKNWTEGLREMSVQKRMALYEEKWTPLLLSLVDKEKEQWFFYLAHEWLKRPMEKEFLKESFHLRKEAQNVLVQEWKTVFVGNHWIHQWVEDWNEASEILESHVEKAKAVMLKHSHERRDDEAVWVARQTFNIELLEYEVEKYDRLVFLRRGSVAQLKKFYEFFFNKVPARELELAVEWKMIMKLNDLGLLNETEKTNWKKIENKTMSYLHLFNLDKSLDGIWRSDWGTACVYAGLINSADEEKITEFNLVKSAEDLLDFGRDLYLLNNTKLTSIWFKTLIEQDIGLSSAQKQYIEMIMHLWNKWVERKEKKGKDPFVHFNEKFHLNLIDSWPLVKKTRLAEAIKNMPPILLLLKNESKERESAFKTPIIDRTSEQLQLTLSLLWKSATNWRMLGLRVINQHLKGRDVKEDIRKDYVTKINEKLEKMKDSSIEYSQKNIKVGLVDVLDKLTIEEEISKNIRVREEIALIKLKIIAWDLKK